MKKILLISLPVLLIVMFVAVYAFTATTNTSAVIDNETNYAALEEPPFMELYNPKSLDEIAQHSHLVVIGKIIETKEPYTDETEVKPGTFEAAVDEKLVKNGRDPLKLSVIPTTIAVQEVLYGNTDAKEITLIQSELTAAYEPKFKKGDNMVFFLREVQTKKDTYSILHPHASYFYISQDNKITPVYQKEDFSTLSGINVNEFKNKVKGAVNKK